MQPRQPFSLLAYLLLLGAVMTINMLGGNLDYFVSSGALGRVFAKVVLRIVGSLTEFALFNRVLQDDRSDLAVGVLALALTLSVMVLLSSLMIRGIELVDEIFLSLPWVNDDSVVDGVMEVVHRASQLLRGYVLFSVANHLTVVPVVLLIWAVRLDQLFGMRLVAEGAVPRVVSGLSSIAIAMYWQTVPAWLAGRVPVLSSVAVLVHRTLAQTQEWSTITAVRHTFETAEARCTPCTPVDAVVSREGSSCDAHVFAIDHDMGPIKVAGSKVLLLRTATHALVVNPMGAPSATLRERIGSRALSLLFMNSMHTSYFVNWLRHFPEATVVANAWQFTEPAASVGAEVRDLQAAEQRAEVERAFEPLGLRLIPVTHGFQETVVWSESLRLLYVNDIFIGVDQLGEPVGLGATLVWLAKRALFLPDRATGLAMQTYGKTLYYKDLAAARAQMRRVVRLPTRVLVLTHGPVVRGADVPAKLERFLGWLVGKHPAAT